MCINQRDAQILVNNLYFFVKRLYMFRTIISPSSGATFNKLYTAIGTFVPVRLAVVLQQYDARYIQRQINTDLITNQRSAHFTLTFYQFTIHHYSQIYALVFSQGV